MLASGVCNDYDAGIPVGNILPDSHHIVSDGARLQLPCWENVTFIKLYASAKLHGKFQKSSTIFDCKDYRSDGQSGTGTSTDCKY